MKKIAPILLLFLLSCNPQRESTENSESPVELETQVTEVIAEPEPTNQNLEPDERFFPESIETERTDTLLTHLGLEISIEQTGLESYVLDEFESGGQIHRHKYRDFSIRLIGKENDQLVIDTTFYKESFDDYIGEFQKESNLSCYWFEIVENNQLKFFGMVSKPETDIAFYFNQYVDLKSWSLRTEQYFEEEI